MKNSQLIGSILCLVQIAFCFLPWVTIPVLQITLNGLHGEVNHDLSFGKQIIPITFFSGCMLLLFSVQKVWAKRTNMFFAFFNLGWAIKNYILFSLCRAGECPKVHVALYIIPVVALGIQVMALLPKLVIKK